MPPSFPETLALPQELSVPNWDLQAAPWRRGGLLVGSAGQPQKGHFSRQEEEEASPFLESAFPCLLDGPKVANIGKQWKGPLRQAQSPVPPLLPAGARADHGTWGWLQILSAPLNCRLTLGRPLNLLSLRPDLENGEGGPSPPSCSEGWLLHQGQNLVQGRARPTLVNKRQRELHTSTSVQASSTHQQLDTRAPCPPEPRLRYMRTRGNRKVGQTDASA